MLPVLIGLNHIGDQISATFMDFKRFSSPPPSEFILTPKQKKHYILISASVILLPFR